MTPLNVPTGSAPSALIRIRLYVAGESPNSLTALANVRSVLNGHPEHPVDLEIIDILSDPERSVRDGILVTPMLVKLEPSPERRVLGNLMDRALLLRALGLKDGMHE